MSSRLATIGANLKRPCFVAAVLCGAIFAQAAAAAGPPTQASATEASAASLFTAPQAARGQGEYEHYCLACHGLHLDDGDMGGPPLRGSYFRGHWVGSAVAPLFAYMKSLMPPDNPGELTDDEYADILAYVLQYNGYKPGADALPTDPAAQAKMKLGPPG